MEIETINVESRKTQGTVVQKTHFTDPRNTTDGSVGWGWFELQVIHGSGIQRNTAAACIEDEIEGIGYIIQFGLYNDDSSGQLNKRNRAECTGGGFNKFFLRPGIKAL